MSDLPLLVSFTNVELHGEDGSFVFVGKNDQGNESAELLNDFQLKGQLKPLPLSCRRKGHGLIRLTYQTDNPNVIKDLRQVCSAKSFTLVGPVGQGVVFVRTRPPLKKEKHVDWNRSDDSGYYANDSGHISNRPGH